jgi:hypothetical protein
VDRRVVDEHVELADLAPQGADLRLVGDVEPDRLKPLDRRHRPGIARAREHVEPAVGELAGHFEPEAAVGAGDERGGHDVEITGANLGLTRNEIDRRVAAGWLQPLHRGVYAVGHRVLTAEGRWMAATLATGGVLSLRPSRPRGRCVRPRAVSST